MRAISRLLVGVSLLLSSAGQTLAGPVSAGETASRSSCVPLRTQGIGWTSSVACKPVVRSCRSVKRQRSVVACSPIEVERWPVVAMDQSVVADFGAATERFDLVTASQAPAFEPVVTQASWIAEPLPPPIYSPVAGGLFPTTLTSFYDSAVFGGVTGRGLSASPASFGASAARGGIMVIRWQAAVPPVGGATAAAGIGGAGAVPLAGGSALGGLGAGASQLAGLAMIAPQGLEREDGGSPDVLWPPVPGDGSLPGGGDVPGGGTPGDGGLPGGGGAPGGGDLPGGGVPGGGGNPGGTDPYPFPPMAPVVVVPEPSTFAMAAAGCVALLVHGRRRRLVAAAAAVH